MTAWDWMTASALWPVGLILAGPAAEAIGVTAACWLSAGLGLVLSLWVLAVKDVWRLRGVAGGSHGHPRSRHLAISSSRRLMLTRR